MAGVLQCLLGCVFLHYSRCAVYEDTFNGTPIKIRQIDPERRPLYLLDPNNELDKHFLLNMRKYLSQDVKGIVNGKIHVIHRSPKTEDLDRNGLWSWTVQHPGYTPTDINTNPEYTELKNVLTLRPWFEPAIGSERNCGNGPKFIVDALVYRPDMNPPVSRISFEYPIGFDNVLKINGRVPHPLGRTAVADKGLNGEWIATLAADLYMIMASILENGVPEFDDEGVLVFEFLLIDRSDGGGHASPGGMVDRVLRETPFDASVREFAEEISGIPTTEAIDALKLEIANLKEEISHLQKGDLNEKAKQDTLKAKNSKLAADIKATKVDFVKKLMEEKSDDKDTEELFRWLWCLYKGLAKDKRDADFGYMETIVFVYDVTLSKTVTPEMIKRSEEVKEKPSFIKITEDWLAQHPTFAMHGEFIEMIRKYIIPVRSNLLRGILPAAGEGLATAAQRAIKKVVVDANTALGSLGNATDVLKRQTSKNTLERIENLKTLLGGEVKKASAMITTLQEVLSKAIKERAINKKPQCGGQADRDALTAGNSAFAIVQNIRKALAELKELPHPLNPPNQTVLTEETEAAMTRIVAAYQQIQYYIHAGQGDKNTLVELSDSLCNEFKNSKKILGTLQTSKEGTPSSADIQRKAFTDLMKAKNVLFRTEKKVREMRSL